MSNKIKLSFVLIIMASITAGAWYFLRSSQVKKVEILGSGQSIEMKEEVAKSSDDASVNTQVDAPVGSNLEKEPVVTIDNKEGQASAKADSKLKIVNKLVNSGFQASNGRKIDTIIIHSSYDAIGGDPYSVSGIIQEYKDYGVSAHYLIGRDGTIYQLVQEKDIAYHAGVSSVPDGRTGVNAFSLGIELINTKTDQMTSQQYAALKSLLGDIKNRYEIKYVLGHNQIAPERKDDPWNFDWKKIR